MEAAEEMFYINSLKSPNHSTAFFPTTDFTNAAFYCHNLLPLPCAKIWHTLVEFE